MSWEDNAPDWVREVKRIPFDLGQIHKFPIVATDGETTGLHWYRDQLFGVAIAAYDPELNVMMSAYFDIRDRGQSFKDRLSKAFMQCRMICNHNIKFDALMYKASGIKLPEDRLECTSVRAALINEHEISFQLDALGLKYLGRGKNNEIYSKLATMFGGKPTREVQIKNLSRAPESLVAEYAVPDAELAALLYHWQTSEIERQELERIWGLERELLPVLLDIEERGVRVDLDRTNRAREDIAILIKQNEKKLRDFAGGTFNPNSPKQMQKLFKVYQDEKGNWFTNNMPLSSTDAGNPSIDADALRRLAERGHEAANLVLALRKSTKADSFLKDHILGHELGGRVYPNYNQTRGDNELGTGTGRFSINDPALQQIPARDKEIASIVRACFIPDDDCDWICADWEQFEFRWFAHYTKDPRILDIYQKDPSADFHKLVADLTGLPRSPRFAGDANAKQINLGLVFGMGDGRLAEEMGLPYTMDTRGYPRAGPEAMAVFAKYHGEIPGVKILLSQASSIAKSRGYVQTIYGRRIRFPGGKYTHKAGGLVFQGSSADCMKRKMIEMHKVSKSEGFDMLLSVHDELDFNTPKSITEKAKAIIKEQLQTFDGERCPIKCRVPIMSSVEVGPNWYEASK